MALPKYTSPIYTLKVPSSGKDLKYRPFLVKDEKNLLLSQQSEEEVSMYDTLKAVIASCIVEGPKVDDLSVFDIEYIFTQLRCKSIGEQVELVFTCQNEKCGEKEPHTFNIDPEIKKNPEHTNKIELFDSVGIMMKYPGTDQMKKISALNLDNPDEIIEMIASHIDFVYDENQVYTSSKKETIQFIENLPRSASDKIKRFFETMPKLSQTVSYSCKHCGETNDYVVECIQNFF
jgi:hypothetical protein